MSKAAQGTAWVPASWEPADAAAIQALAAGTATPEQQRRALTWIVQQACRTYDLSYQPGSERDTAFAEGRRFVGLQVVKLTNISLAALRQAKEAARR